MDAYLEFTIGCTDEVKDALIAELAELEFEGFVETDSGFSAYVPESLFNQANFDFLLRKYGLDPEKIPSQVIDQQNWNAQWEAGYEPIFIDKSIVIRAPFHPVYGGFETELIIQPKNTFGTGHHETTQLMLKLMRNMQFSESMVLDYGCGTGVLAIMAAKLGAAKVLAIDIDKWCLENVPENIALNNVDQVQFELGDLSILSNEMFSIILANINKNILTAGFEKLSALSLDNGKLLISGFYESDLDDLRNSAAKSGWNFENAMALNKWCSALFTKSSNH